MSIQLSSNFNLNAQLPLDSRLVVNDLTARDAIPDVQRYEGLFTYVVSESKTYQLQGGITNADWVESGGGASGAGITIPVPQISLIAGQQAQNVRGGGLVTSEKPVRIGIDWRGQNNAFLAYNPKIFLYRFKKVSKKRTANGVFNTIAERDALPEEQRFDGYVCYVFETNSGYMLTNDLVTWEVFNTRLFTRKTFVHPVNNNGAGYYGKKWFSGGTIRPNRVTEWECPTQPFQKKMIDIDPKEYHGIGGTFAAEVFPMKIQDYENYYDAVYPSNLVPPKSKWKGTKLTTKSLIFRFAIVIENPDPATQADIPYLIGDLSDVLKVYPKVGTFSDGSYVYSWKAVINSPVKPR